MLGVDSEAVTVHENIVTSHKELNDDDEKLKFCKLIFGFIITDA